MRIINVMIFLQYLTLFLNSDRMLPQFLQWYSSSLSSSSAFPLNVFAHQVFSVVILSLLVLSGWDHPEITLEFMLSFTTCIQPMSRRYFSLEIIAVFLLSSSISLCYAHSTFPGHLVSHWALPEYLFLLHHLLRLLIYLSLLSLLTLSSSLFHVAT